MPKNHKENLPNVWSTKVFNMLNDKRFKHEMDQKYVIDKKHDVPYLAGYSKNDRTIYFDRHFPTNMNGVNIEKYITLHEKTEKALIDIFGLHYQQAHHIATHVEHMSLVADGLNWKKYTAYCEKYIKPCGHEKVTNPPPNLDLTPYQDEKDYENLKELVNDSNSKPKKRKT